SGCLRRAGRVSLVLLRRPAVRPSGRLHPRRRSSPVAVRVPGTVLRPARVRPPMVRTVSKLPAATEIVGALGLMDQLVAVSHECDFPAEANARPRVTHCEIYNQGLPSEEIDRWVSEKLRNGESLYTLDEPLLREL